MTVAAFESVWDRTIAELDAAGLIDRFHMLEQERRHIEAELAELTGEVDRREVLELTPFPGRGWCVDHAAVAAVVSKSMGLR